jgi:uncharacterized protein
MPIRGQLVPSLGGCQEQNWPEFGFRALCWTSDALSHNIMAQRPNLTDIPGTGLTNTTGPHYDPSAQAVNLETNDRVGESEMRLDRKGITSFLLITFGITYAIELALILAGFRITQVPAMYGQLVVAGVMWVPALATFITVRFITREGFAGTNFRFGPWRPYLMTGLVIPLCFALIYLLTWGLRLGQPDWKLEEFTRMIAASGGTAIPSMPPPAVVLPALFLVTVIFAPILNGVFGLGEELGWRGYLLPKLMPLGKVRAYFVLGLVWSLWHLPLILVGFTYPGHPFLGFVAFTALLWAFGIYLNELTLRYRSCVLAGWMHGVFNSQKLGVWGQLFPNVNPLIGGFAGLCGIVVWLLLGLFEIRRGRRSSKQPAL